MTLPSADVFGLTEATSNFGFAPGAGSCAFSPLGNGTQTSRTAHTMRILLMMIIRSARIESSSIFHQQDQSSNLRICESPNGDLP
jgi:hypothetical protein